MSKNIELSDEQYEGIKAVAETLGIPITEFILRSIKATTTFLDFFPEKIGEQNP